MMLSQVIEMLQALMEEHGDVPVYYGSPLYDREGVDWMPVEPEFVEGEVVGHWVEFEDGSHGMVSQVESFIAV